MNNIRYYKGLYRVKIVTESVGYYIIEAQEVFEDIINGKKIKVLKGEQKIVTPNTLFKKITFLSPIQEHDYELKMEKKLKQLKRDQEKQNINPK